jgi:hypothetical protein
MSVMLVAAITDDPLGIVLAVGVLVSASSAVVYFTGRSTNRSHKRAAPTEPQTPAVAPREIMSASSALARAQAAALERSTAAASAEGYRLTGVRPVRAREAPPEYPQRVERAAPQAARASGQAAGGQAAGGQAAGGQAVRRADRDGSDRDVVTAQARAIAFHIAENDPQRMAEVIRTWIRQDLEREHDSR